MARGLARKTLFNRATVPPLQRRLAHLDRRSRLAEWTFWKIMLHHTDAGYMAQSPRRPIPVPTRPAVTGSRRDDLAHDIEDDDDRRHGGTPRSQADPQVDRQARLEVAS